MAGSKLSGNVVTTTEIHLIWPLAGKGRMWNDGVVLLHIEDDEIRQGREGVELMQVEPAVCQGAPPGFNHGVREGDFDQGERPAKWTDFESGVDFLVYVLDAGISNDRGCVSACAQMLAGLGEELASGLGSRWSATFQAEMRRLKLSMAACR